MLVFPLNPDSLGNREFIRGHSFRIREGVQFDVQTVWPLLAGVIPNDPNVAPPFVDPAPEGVLEDDIQVFPSPSPVIHIQWQNHLLRPQQQHHRLCQPQLMTRWMLI